MTGEELAAARVKIGEHLKRRVSQSDMAELVGLSDPERNGADTIRKWERSDGPSGPVRKMVEFLLAGLDDRSIAVRQHFERHILAVLNNIPL